MYEYVWYEGLSNICLYGIFIFGMRELSPKLITLFSNILHIIRNQTAYKFIDIRIKIFYYKLAKSAHRDYKFYQRE